MPIAVPATPNEMAAATRRQTPHAIGCLVQQPDFLDLPSAMFLSSCDASDSDITLFCTEGAPGQRY